MAIPLDILRCPETAAPLEQIDDHTLGAVGSHIRYPIVQGIADLRLFDPPYISREAEQREVAQLAEAAATMDYKSLLRHYVENIETRTGSREDTNLRFRRLTSLVVRAKKRFDYLFAAAQLEGRPIGQTVLDLGCGGGEALGALARQGTDRILGMDISLTSLLLCQKLMEHEGIHAELFAGCAEAIPCVDNCFDFIYSSDVIEHVSNQQHYLKETHRILAPGGHALINSPNRFSIVSPEPHVHVWGLGFLPRSLMDPTSRLLGKGPYEAKRLISLRELRSLLDSTQSGYEIHTRKSNPQSISLAGKLFHWLSPWSEQLFAHICDQHVILTHK